MASPQQAISMDPELMSDASHDAAKLQQALISCGVTLSTAALSLIIFRPPGGIFLCLRGGALVYLYYGFLVIVASLGVVEMSFGYWVVPRNPDLWRAIGKTMLWVSILGLVVVAALGGGVVMKH